MRKVTYHPLQWYVDKIERGEPFSSLLFGDGEFQVAMGRRNNGTMAYGEVVTERMVTEMRGALTMGPPAVFGTDPHIMDWESYTGRDVAFFRDMCEGVAQFFGGRDMEFVDGTVWDVAVREGNLAPFLQAVNKHPMVLVANDGFRPGNGIEFLKPNPFIEIPRSNAYAHTDEIERMLIGSYQGVKGKNPVYLLCMGIGAVPLIYRVQKQMPDATLLDLGSVLDVFVGQGAGRGWRSEMYADPAKLRDCISKNLEGVVKFSGSTDDPFSNVLPFTLLQKSPKHIVLGGLGNEADFQSALKYWPDAMLIGVDPDPRAIQWQKDHGWPEQFPLIQSALSDKPELKEINWSSICCASVHPDNLAVALPEELGTVTAITLDGIDKDLGPLEDAILWLDLEGWDYNALIGANTLLASGRVQLVCIEVRYSLNESTNPAMRELLSKAGYEHVYTWFQQWWGHNELWRRIEC